MEITELMEIVVDHIVQHPQVDAAAMLLLCKEHDITIKDFSGTMYKLLSSFLTEGVSKTYSGSYNNKQVKMGTIVEAEHTTCSILATKIARDHLAEIPDYYTRLEVMEDEAHRIKPVRPKYF